MRNQEVLNLLKKQKEILKDQRNPPNSRKKSAFQQG